MRLVVIIALLSLSCGGVVETSSGHGGAGDGAGSASGGIGGACGNLSSATGSGGASECAQPPPECRDYCGSVDFSGRCLMSFGAEYTVLIECGAGIVSVDCCQSLSDFSVGLASDCEGETRNVYCCIGVPAGASAQ